MLITLQRRHFAALLLACKARCGQNGMLLTKMETDLALPRRAGIVRAFARFVAGWKCPCCEAG